MDQIKIRRTPGFKPPCENLFVKAARAAHIVGGDSKTLQIIRHAGSIKEHVAAGLALN
jgi:hypothetical protein